MFAVSLCKCLIMSRFIFFVLKKNTYRSDIDVHIYTKHCNFAPTKNIYQLFNNLNNKTYEKKKT